MFAKLRDLDRKYIFLMVALSIVASFVFPLNLPLKVKDADTFKTEIDSVPNNSPILISMDFDPGSAPELTPIAKALVYYALKINKKVIIMTVWQTGVGLCERTMIDAVAKLNAEGIKKEYGIA